MNDIKDRLAVGMEVYYLFEETSVHKVRITAVGGSQGCCIEPVDPTENFAIDTALYSELFLFPFTLDISRRRMELWVNDLQGEHRFMITGGSILETLLKLDEYEQCQYILDSYSEELEDILEIEL